MSRVLAAVFFFFFNDTATTEIYTLSLHDALPILVLVVPRAPGFEGAALSFEGEVQPSAELDGRVHAVRPGRGEEDRKSTRLNSSHTVISYAVFCLKKKKDHDDLQRNHQRDCDHST